jgi:hypothetical protein
MQIRLNTPYYCGHDAHFFYTIQLVTDNGCDIQDIRVITKLPNSEQSYKGKVKTHNYINRQNQSTTGQLYM